jgi:tRNA 2-thiocytidine biosynthesis protein TtcA
MDGRLYKTTFHWFKKAVEDYHLLEEGDKVLIAVSGGADSITLLHLFDHFNRKRKKNWQLLPVHINPNFPNWKTKSIEKLFKSIGLPYLIEDIDVTPKLKEMKFNPCFVCSRERRKRLFEIARQQDIQKIAFAHHLEDVVETFLLNLFYTSKSATLVPRQKLFQGRLNIIRPLYFLDKELINKYLKTNELKPINNKCPYAQSSEREKIRRMLKKFYALNKRIKTNIFWGIKNIKTQYLP